MRAKTYTDGKFVHINPMQSEYELAIYLDKSNWDDGGTNKIFMDKKP